MLRKIVDLLLLLGVLTISAHAQLSNFPVTVTAFGVGVAEHFPHMKAAIVHIQNNSNKDVASFNLAMVQKLANGETVTSVGAIEDCGALASHEGIKDYHGKTQLQWLNAGEGYDARILLTSDVVSVQFRLKAVIYANRTADGDPDAIQDMMETRRAGAEDAGRRAIAAKGGSMEDAAIAVADYNKAVAYAKDDIRCGKQLCSSLVVQP